MAGNILARLLFRRKSTDSGGDLKEWVIWRVPRGARHPDGIRYRLAFVPGGKGEPAVLYDNHHPKGHHKHVDGQESAYEFAGVDRLLADFQDDIRRWKSRAR
jgi:hypothetical protein